MEQEIIRPVSKELLKSELTPDKQLRLTNKSFAGYVDGKFVPFDEVPKSPWVRCVLTETPIRKAGKLHHLRFMAVDNRDNKRIYETDFSY